MEELQGCPGTGNLCRIILYSLVQKKHSRERATDFIATRATSGGQFCLGYGGNYCFNKLEPYTIAMNTIKEDHCMVEEEEDEAINLHRLDQRLFEDIGENLKKIEVCQVEERRDRKKIEQINKFIDSAQEILTKAEEKKKHLIKRRELLLFNLESNQQRVTKALDYWKDYGFDVRELSTEQDNIKHYEYIYTKLTRDRKQHQDLEVGGDQVDNNSPETKYRVGIKVQDKAIQIVSVEPSNILDADKMEDLNAKLNDICIHGDSIDYKLAMLTIRKSLVKNPSSHP